MKLTDLNSATALLAFALLVLPGFISMRVYSLIRPGKETPLKDSLFEALAYGALNAGLNALPLLLLFRADSVWAQGLLALWSFAIGPIVWPFLLDRALGFLSRRDWITYGERSGWDYFFKKRRRCWLIIHMPDGTRIGGAFKDDSFATVHPVSGHLFIEEVWTLDEESGRIVGDEPASHGLILKPNDYRFIEIVAYMDDEEPGDGE